jgi:transposase-like protein
METNIPRSGRRSVRLRQRLVLAQAGIGCSGETLRKWVRQADRDHGGRPGPTGQERDRIKELERENRELRQANEILRKASAPFRPLHDRRAIQARGRSVDL